MHLNKRILNNRSKKYAMLAMAAASVLGACSKDEPAIEQHDTTYTFAPDNSAQLRDLAQIKRSADSAAVRYIYFKATSGKKVALGWEGIDLSALVKFIDPAFDAAKGKGRAAGTIDRVSNYPEAANAIQKLRDYYGYILNLIEESENER